MRANPEVELGAPPPSIATPGRMSPRGISVFYGAFDEATALAELRLVPGEVAVTARFSISQAIKVFDLTALRTVYEELSYFDPDYRPKASKLSFLRSFDDEISRPVVPSEESLEYIPTQVLVEFLFNNYHDAVDAIVYSSPQTSGNSQNIAVKHEVSGVRCQADVIQQAKSESTFEEMWTDYGYSLYRRKTIGRRLARQISFEIDDYMVTTRPQQQRLTLERDAVRIHRVKTVGYKLDSDTVSFSFLKDI